MVDIAIGNLQKLDLDNDLRKTFKRLIGYETKAEIKIFIKDNIGIDNIHIIKFILL